MVHYIVLEINNQRPPIMIDNILGAGCDSINVRRAPPNKGFSRNTLFANLLNWKLVLVRETCRFLSCCLYCPSKYETHMQEAVYLLLITATSLLAATCGYFTLTFHWSQLPANSEDVSHIITRKVERSQQKNYIFLWLIVNHSILILRPFIPKRLIQIPQIIFLRLTVLDYIVIHVSKYSIYNDWRHNCPGSALDES